MKNCNELSPQIFAAQNEFSLEISSRINVIKEYVAESSSRSKQYMPRKFAEMSSKFRFGQEFVEKLGISSNFVDRCLHYFCTILFIQKVNNLNVKEIKTYFGLAPNGGKQLVTIIQQRQFNISRDDLVAMIEIESLHVYLNGN